MGQTGRNLSDRLIEHKHAIRNAHDNSAVFSHVSNLGYTINWNNASIVYKSKCSFRRKIVEAAKIQSIPNFHLSRGQWSPDNITSVAVGKTSPVSCDLRRPSHSAQGHVT